MDEAFFPFPSRCVSLSSGRIHYFDVGPDKPKGTILAFHGNPTWSIVFTNLAQQAVAAGYRFVAFDYFGYGLSDKPDPEKFDYFIHSQAKVGAEFMRALELKDVTVVVQDGGGPVGLGAAQLEDWRVQGLVVINAWFKETRPIPEGTTSPQFALHDWSLDNIVNEDYMVGTGFNSFAGARAVVRGWGLDKDSAPAAALTRLMLSPYFEGGDVARPLSEKVHLPHVRLVQSVVKDDEFFRNLEAGMRKISSKPVYLMFTEPTVFSRLHCDTGPRSRINFSSPDAARYGAVPLEGRRALCPPNFMCSEMPARPFQSFCQDSQGADYRYIVEDFRSVWSKERIVGEFLEEIPGSEYLTIQRPDAVLNAIEAVRSF